MLLSFKIELALLETGPLMSDTMIAETGESAVRHVVKALPTDVRCHPS